MVAVTKKYRRKRNVFRKKRTYRRRYRIQKSILPNRFVTKLRYQTFATVNPGAAGATGVYVMCANGMFDPDITGIGHQPRGFDQFATLYGHYTVLGAKITVRAHTRNANVYDQIFCVALKADSPTFSDMNDYLEGRNVKSKMLDAGPSAMGKQIVMNFSAKRFFGKKDILGDDLYRAAFSANPTERAYFHIACAPIQAVDAANIDLDIRIDYIAAFTEPILPNQS